MGKAADGAREPDGHQAQVGRRGDRHGARFTGRLLRELRRALDLDRGAPERQLAGPRQQPGDDRGLGLRPGHAARRRGAGGHPAGLHRHRSAGRRLLPLPLQHVPGGGTGRRQADALAGARRQRQRRRRHDRGQALDVQGRQGLPDAVREGLHDRLRRPAAGLQEDPRPARRVLEPRGHHRPAEQDRRLPAQGADGRRPGHAVRRRHRQPLDRARRPGGRAHLEGLGPGRRQRHHRPAEDRRRAERRGGRQGDHGRRHRDQHRRPGGRRDQRLGGRRGARHRLQVPHQRGRRGRGHGRRDGAERQPEGARRPTRAGRRRCR